LLLKEETMKKEDVRKAVRERYGSIAREGSIGCGCGCGAGDSAQDLVSLGQSIGYSSADLTQAPKDANLGLGCGNPTAMAELEAGEVVLDLGSGGGIDCFLAAQRVGPQGKVYGVDMTPEMVSRARTAAAAGGYENVEFRLGEVEALPIPDSVVDATISNCVLNLSPERERVYREVMRVLKPGGRIMISDLISAVPTPEFLLESTEALVGCLPVHEEEYLRGLEVAGFEDVEIVEERSYPNELLTTDPSVQSYLDSHPWENARVLEFLGSIRSGLIKGRKPRA